MKFVQESGDGDYLLRSFETNKALVSRGLRRDSGEVDYELLTVETSFLLMPEHLISDDLPDQVTKIDSGTLKLISELQPELLLLGSGASMVFPAVEIMSWFNQRRIGLEVMTSAAACRTFNVLVLEGRRVAALIMAE